MNCRYFCLSMSLQGNFGIRKNVGMLRVTISNQILICGTCMRNNVKPIVIMFPDKKWVRMNDRGEKKGFNNKVFNCNTQSQLMTDQMRMPLNQCQPIYPISSDQFHYNI